MTSEYEKKRLENIEANKRILRELGLERPPPVLPIRRLRQKGDDVISRDEKDSRVRRSSRLAKLPVKVIAEVSFDETYRSKNAEWRKNRPDPKQFGEITGVQVGAWWPTRMECSHHGVHAPTVAGIAFVEDEGAYSVALSGGYEDDVDWGEAFTYTGSGGRDLKGTKQRPKNLRTAPQTRDQVLAAGNKALKISCETSKPVRVIRGYNLNNEYSPEEGYRYDGLYTVEKWWEEIGLAGFRVYKYAFKRIPGQLPLGTCEKSWSDSEVEDNDD
ncbi:8966_t:CDS:2 [Funneliformis mosseae]|uniref:8966_t:CDS:1 n=1 Tax=Funneliformis mosseae TaxID=27381 RepID=A0A9N9F4Z6_FUNMO|nr:8966_t:CDS:2 [Funneliformis mosseae]